MNSLLKAVTTSIQVWSSHISAMIECKTHHLFSLPKFYCSPRDRIGLCHIPQHWDILIWCSDLRGGNRFAICWIYQSMAMFLVQNALLVLFNIPSLKSENLWSQDTSRSTTVCSILLSIHRESSRKTNKHWSIDPMILWNKHPICTVLPSTFRLPKLSKFWPSNPSSAPCSISVIYFTNLQNSVISDCPEFVFWMDFPGQRLHSDAHHTLEWSRNHRGSNRGFTLYLKKIET